MTLSRLGSKAVSRYIVVLVRRYSDKVLARLVEELIQTGKLFAGQVAKRSRPLPGEPHRSDRGAHQALDRMPHHGQHSPHDVVSALVQHDLDDRTTSARLDLFDRVGLGRAILQ